MNLSIRIIVLIAFVAWLYNSWIHLKFYVLFNSFVLPEHRLGVKKNWEKLGELCPLIRETIFCISDTNCYGNEMF